MRISVLLLALTLLVSLARPGVAQYEYDAFVKAYESARTTNDAAGMKRVLKKFPGETIWYFERAVDKAVFANDLKAAEEVEALKTGFQDAWGSTVLERIENYRRGLDREAIDRVAKIQSEEQVGWSNFDQVKKSDNEAEWRRTIEDMHKVAMAMDQTGDKLKAADTWLKLVGILEAFKKKTQDDRTLQLQAMERYVQNFQDWDWTKTTQYAQNAAWLRGIKAQLEEAAKKGTAGGGGDGAAPATGESAEPEGLTKFKEGSSWETAKLDYEVAKRSEEGISLYASSCPLNWLGFHMAGTDPVQMQFFKDGNIFLQREGAAKFVNPLTSNADPKARVAKLAGPKKAVDLFYDRTDKDGEIYETNYAFFLWTGGNQEQFNNVSLNMAPQWSQDKKTANVYVKSAAYFKAKVAGTDVTLFDENCNGVFGDKPGALAYNTYDFGGGLQEPMRHEIFDSMKVGGGKLVPFSPLVQLGKDWYLLKVIRNNEELRYRPLAEVPTGTIKVDWKGSRSAKPKHLLVREIGGAWPDAIFDVMSNPKGIDVPVGKYEVFYGRVINGKVPRNMDAIVLKGDSKSLEVKVGEDTVMELGAPFAIDGVFEREAGKIAADTTKMWVRDRFGMRYTGLQGEVLEPQFVIAHSEDGKNAKVLGEWRRVADADLNPLSKKHDKISGLTLSGFAIDKKSGGDPSFRIRVDNPIKEGTFFLGARQKKHKLFGPLDAVFK
ncbi:MAG: hypothetical protein KDC95_07940 [Planctomycetes bacterium]|nr:hypothetical protein [Planctomycetota bacterium]